MNIDGVELELVVSLYLICFGFLAVTVVCVFCSESYWKVEPLRRLLNKKNFKHPNKTRREIYSNRCTSHKLEIQEI
jgi:ABC-type microcin C transport system permease subunit YejB